MTEMHLCRQNFRAYSALESSEGFIIGSLLAEGELRGGVQALELSEAGEGGDLDQSHFYWSVVDSQYYIRFKCTA